HFDTSAVSFSDQYRKWGNLQDLEAALENSQAAVAHTPDHHPGLPMRLHGLAVSFRDRYQRSGNLQDLEAALDNSKAAVAHTPEGHPDLPGWLQNLAVLFRDRYRRSGNLQDLEAALVNDQVAVAHTPEGHPDLPGRFHSLAVSFRDQYRRSGKLQDLETALENSKAAVAHTPKGHPDLPGRLQNLAVSFRDQYQRSGDLQDLQAALENVQAAVAHTPEGHPDLPEQLQNLAVFFSDQYRRSGNLQDLEAALVNGQAAVAHTPESHPDLPRRLQNLAVFFSDQYQRSGNLQDLQAALENIQAAVAHTPVGHLDLPGRLQNLAVSFRDRYRRSGNLQDLEAALENVQAAVAHTPEGHPDLPRRLHHLALFFSDRYQRSGNLQDLEAALVNDQAAVAHTSESHPDLPRQLQNLAVSFRDRYQRSGNLQDLQAALENVQAAVAHTPEGHPDLPGQLQNLAESFRDRYRKSGNLQDLEAALENDQAAVAHTPEGHPDLPGRLQDLAESFRDRYQRSGNLQDLEAALENDQAAVAHTPEGHPDLPGQLQNLAVSFRYRYQRLGNLQDLDNALSTYGASFKSTSSNLVNSWKSALSWASLAKSHKPGQILEAYSAAFHLLPDILWIGTSIYVRQDTNRRINVAQATSDAISACIDLGNLFLAIELLEQGLGTSFQQLLQLKTNVDVLPQEYATELHNLSVELYSGTTENPQRVAAQRHALIRTIRQLPGLENFLLPRPYTDLCHVSQWGPIIILNSHPDHCDTIILFNPASDPLHIRLNVSVVSLKAQKSLLKDLIQGRIARSRESQISRMKGGREGLERGIEGLLVWIWTSVVKPIYTALEANGIISGRLWWCPTGDFTALPLHAADSKDQFIHSYTSTLGSLIEANSRKLLDDPSIGVVGVTHTGPGRYQALPGVQQEITNIISLVRDKYQLQSLIGEQATVNAVRAQLNDCAYIHLACHGAQDLVDPPKSCLQLYGGNLELETILQMPLPKAEFIFLAACQTAKGDAELVNESFHLGGGFIAAGFQGAIATMWSMCDEDGPVVAETVYGYLFGSGERPRALDGAKALQLAVRRLRDAGVPYERWVPFIHLGI
ncbi:CHAT domain-containing protein, partial [Mycena maculata]